MPSLGTPLLELPPAEFEAALDRIFGPDVLHIPCAFCGEPPGEFCITRGGRGTLHKVRMQAVRSPAPECTGRPGCSVAGHEEAS